MPFTSSWKKTAIREVLPPSRCPAARVTLAQVGAGFNITRIELRTVGEVPGVGQAAFHELAERAKDCTVSRALAGTEITLEASIAGG
jgi:osmotically inducible protein OsmC